MNWDTDCTVLPRSNAHFFVFMIGVSPTAFSSTSTEKNDKMMWDIFKWWRHTHCRRELNICNICNEKIDTFSESCVVLMLYHFIYMNEQAVPVIKSPYYVYLSKTKVWIKNNNNKKIHLHVVDVHNTPFKWCLQPSLTALTAKTEARMLSLSIHLQFTWYLYLYYDSVIDSIN